MQEKLDRMIEYLTESHLSFYGGYPYGFFVDDDSELVHVAELDDGKERRRTLIASYKVDQLIDWYDRAEAYLIDDSLPTEWDHYTGDDFGYWNEAINETQSGIERVQSD